MERRSFFGILFGGLLARFLPKLKPWGNQTLFGHEFVEAENITFEGCVARATDPTKPCSLTTRMYPTGFPVKMIAAQERSNWLHNQLRDTVKFLY
jgi:hypothetical protein